MTKLYDLTTEKLRRAPGIDVRYPRFGWKISSDAKDLKQVSYRLLVKDKDGDVVWDSGTTESDEPGAVYDGEDLCFAEDYVWELSADFSNGETASASGFFSTGLMGAHEDLGARFIKLPYKDGHTRDTVTAFRKDFNAGSGLRKARLFVSGAGVYEAYINGESVYDTDPAGEVHRYDMKPGFTEILNRRFYHSYDVTPMIGSGTNCLSAVAGTGWYSDRIALRGDFPEFMAVLILEYGDGNGEVVVTDGTWRASADQPVRAAGIWDGEDYDARVSDAFMKPGFDDSGWETPALSDYFTGELESMHGEPVSEREDLTRRPVDVYTFTGAKGAKEPSAPDAKDGEAGVIDGVVRIRPGDPITLRTGETLVVDFGQNAAGRERFTVKGKKGTVVTIRHGEMLNDRNGERSRGNDGPGGSVYLENMRSARAATVYTIGSDDTDETFKPVHTFYGFRYVQVTADGDVVFTDIEARTLTSVGYDSGYIETGSELVNKLFKNGRWGMYSNYVSIPTDCPQRDERLGWTADTQVFSAAAQYYSTAAQSFLEKWMQDMQDSQAVDGAYPSVAPTGPWQLSYGALGWADAGIIVPYCVWRMSGDTTIIEENYLSMRIYMDHFLQGKGNAGPIPCYGDWLSFEPNDNELQVFLGVCYYAWDAMLMSEMAEVTGRTDDSERYAAIYQRQKEFFISQYVNEDGTIKLSQQTAALFALRLGLLPDDRSVGAVKASLVENIKAHGDLLQTGFLSTGILLPTLSENGLNDVAYTLLLSDGMPSWLYSVKAGATTVWERWNSYSLEKGFGDVGMNSFNHYAYGCVTEWMFEYMAGIRPEYAGFEEFILAPLPDRRVGFCRASYESDAGLIESYWRFEGDRLVYECAVPANATAKLILPFGGGEKTLGSGKYRFEVTC